MNGCQIAGLPVMVSVPSVSMLRCKSSGDFSVTWFNPRSGGKEIASDVKQVRGGASATLGHPPTESDQDWVIVVRR
jgi:Putative collagen-binding domain of a collagenase